MPRLTKSIFIAQMTAVLWIIISMNYEFYEIKLLALYDAAKKECGAVKRKRESE